MGREGKDPRDFLSSELSGTASSTARGQQKFSEWNTQVSGHRVTDNTINRANCVDIQVLYVFFFWSRSL